MNRILLLHQGAFDSLAERLNQEHTVDSPQSVIDLADYSDVSLVAYTPDSPIEVSSLFAQQRSFSNTTFVCITDVISPAERASLYAKGFDEIVVFDTVEDAALQINHMMKKSESIEGLVYRDELTGAYNRRFFDRQLNLQIANSKGEPISLAIIDLDKFKMINDEYGHAVGDDVLKNFVNVASTHIKEPHIFARYGGEEFALVMPGLTGKVAQEFVNQLLVQLRKEPLIEVHSKAVHVTFSAGVSEYQEHMSIDAWIQKADDAAYEAKRAGRNQVILSDQTEEPEHNILRLLLAGVSNTLFHDSRHEIHIAKTEADILNVLDDDLIDICIIDQSSCFIDMKTLQFIKKKYPYLKVLLLVEDESIDVFLHGLQLGIEHILQHPVASLELEMAFTDLELSLTNNRFNVVFDG